MYSHCICHHPLAVFCWVDLQPDCVQTSTYYRIYIPIRIHRLDIREDANNHKVIGCKCLSGNLCTAVERTSRRWILASEVLFPRCTSTSLCWWFRRWSGFWCRLCTLLFIVQETTLVSSRTLSFCCPLIAFSLSSFNTDPLRFVTSAMLNSVISGVKVSKSEFLMCFFLPSFLFLFVGH